MQWLRLYDDVLDDPKVQRLPPDLFKHWINLLCLANKGTPRGVLPSEHDIAFRLRMGIADTAVMLADLFDAGLLIHVDENWKPHNWDERQFKSDDVNARVKSYRERNVTRNVTPEKTETLHVTPPDTDTEQSRAESPPIVPPVGGEPKPKKKVIRATQVPDGWLPDPAYVDWAVAEGFTKAELEGETAKFVRHHRSKGNTFKDIGLAWQNWMDRSRQYASRASPSNGYAKPEERRPKIPRFDSFAHRYGKESS